MNNNPKLRFKDKNGIAYPEWEEKAMEHFGTFLKGNNLSKADLTPNGYPCILYGELYTKYSEITEKIHSYTDRLETNQTIGNMNDVLIPSSGETAIDISTATCLLVNNVLLGGDLNVFRPKEQDGRFISYELNHKKRRKIASIAQGATVVHLYPNFLKKLKIILPCLEEQEKIAGFLSKVDELINECEGEVKDLEEQKKGLMQKIFSQQIRFKDSNNNPYPDWKEHCINEFIISLKSGLSRELQNEDIGIPVIRANNTYNGIVGGNDIKYWYKKDPKGANIDNYILDDGDILINFINSLPRMGETAIYTNFLNRPCIYTTNLLRLKLNNKLNYKYFFYYTKTSEYINYIKAITKPAVNQASFTTVDFKNMKLLLPCLEEQEKIAKVLSKMDELIEEKKALLSDWQQFKKGLLQQMFV